MTDKTQELDEVAQLLGIYLSEIDVDGSMPTIITRQDLERVLDWHNKQIEEVLDRLENSPNAAYSGTQAHMMINDAIRAERNKLKESTDE